MNSPLDIDPLIDLVHHRWSVPVIAELHCRSGAKFVTLIHSLGVSRGSLSASLADLIEQGLVKRNPGHGHPMRPEYLLTVDGAHIGEQCSSLTQLVRRGNDFDFAFRKWTLPIVAAIGRDVCRFNQVSGALGDATPRAITLGLKSLLGRRWAARSLIDAYPPAAGYQLMPMGQRVLKQIDGLY